MVLEGWKKHLTSFRGLFGVLVFGGVHHCLRTEVVTPSPTMPSKKKTYKGGITRCALKKHQVRKHMKMGLAPFWKRVLQASIFRGSVSFCEIRQQKHLHGKTM